MRIRSVARRVGVPLLILGLSAVPRPALADGAPSAERIKSAAAEYDAGRRAFTDGKFEDAAAHFENAYHDAPNAQTLRNAIRARKQAGQLARAASLSVIAFSKYPDDEPTAAIVKETLAEAEPKLFKLSVACSPECGVASDGRVLSLEDAKKFVFFLDPGPHAMVVSWTGDRTKQVDVVAKAGQNQDFTLVAPPMPVKPVGPGTGGGEATPSTKPLGPALFFVTLGLTAVAGGVTIWSGMDTINNPGADAVRQQCAGKGETCQAYVDGRASQLRTNVLIGVTSGLGAVTLVVGLFLTQWSTPKQEPAPAPAAAKLTFRPYLDVGATSTSGGLVGSF
jgi:hypothetical protein